MRTAIVHDASTNTSADQCLKDSLANMFSSTVRPEDAELVISTSRRAAQRVRQIPGQLHLCYQRFATADESLPRVDESPSVQTARIFNLRDNSPVSTKFAPRDQQAGMSNVSHFLAGNHRIADGLRRETGRPTKVIYPPVETSQFRPNRARRSDYYVTSILPGQEQELDLAVRAARIARRRLLVLVDGHSGGNEPTCHESHVQIIAATTDEETRRALCECRAFLCCADTDFDADVIRAQACGTPVIVSSQSGVSELVADAEEDGPGTGLYFYERTPDGLAAAMAELERRPQKFSAPLAWAQAMQFSASRFERELGAYVEQLRAASTIDMLDVGGRAAA